MKNTFVLLLLIIVNLSAKSQDIDKLYYTVDSLFKTNKTACLKQVHNLEKIALKQKNDTVLSYSYNIQARIYYKNKKYSRSIKYFEKELNLNKNSVDKNVLAESQYNIGSTCLKLKRNFKAKTYFEQSLELSKSIQYEMLIYANNEALYSVCVKLNDYKSALKYFKALQSFDEKEYNQSIGLFQKKYFKQKSITAKKERELHKTSQNLNKTKSSLNNAKYRLNQTNTELDSAENQVAILLEDSIRQMLSMNSLKIQAGSAEMDSKAELKQQRRYTFTFVGAFIIILVLSIFMYKLFLTKKKMNKNLVKQKSKITNQNLQIQNSIKYARKIQNAVLASDKLLDNTFHNNFIFFKAKDYVSGDFYWFYKEKDIFWGAIVDCTGHGVPGAFMSIIGTNLINKIIRGNKIQQPSELLKELNKEVKITLNQEHSGEISEDGMDMTVFKVNTKEKTLSLSLANHNAFIIQDNKIETIEGDIFSIGDNLSNSLEVSYVDYNFDYTKETVLYMFSDGFQDQFGGVNDKKYTQKQLKEKLFEIHKLEFDKQKEIMKSELVNWQNDKSQIDDILLVGIKF